MAWNFAQRHRHNVQTLRRSPIAEISGALGDLGTLLPLMTALAVQGSISLSSTLVWSGLFNVATGLLFGLPLPVQPMKAIAAAAIASHTSLRDTVAAGALVSAAVLLLAVTGLLRWLAAWVPVPVVKGIQLGAGLSLVISAGASLLGPLGWVHPSAFDNRLWALAAFAGLLVTQRTTVGVSAPPSSDDTSTNRRRGGGTVFFPYALFTFVVGLALAIATALVIRHHALPRVAFWHPHFVLPHFLAGDAWSMAVAQLPLTTLNSVVAVSALAGDLFTSSDAYLTASVTSFGLSVGAMNLVGCWFGAMPVCHGAGGLAAQYRFGARSGASIVLLGLAKALLGLFLGETLVDLLGSFPKSILGVLVLASGLELAMAGASLNQGATDLRGDEERNLTADQRRERWTVMLMTTAGILAFKNDAVGFLAGLLCHAAYRLSDWLAARGSSRHSPGEARALLS